MYLMMMLLLLVVVLMSHPTEYVYVEGMCVHALASENVSS